MKLISALLASLGIFSMTVMGVSLVQAQITQEAEVSLPNPGILPDSPFYGLDLAMERIGDWFTTGQAKVKRDTSIAEERLAEAQSMSDKGKSDLVEAAFGQSQDRLQEATDDLDKLDLPDQDKTDLLLNIQEAVQKHLTVLDKVKAKAPEAAQKGLQNAIDNSSKVIQKMEDVRSKIKTGDATDEIKSKLKTPPALDEILKKAKNHGNENTNGSPSDENEDRGNSNLNVPVGNNGTR